MPEGAQLCMTTLFLVYEDRRKNLNTTKMGHYRLASETSFKWRFAGGPMITGA